MDIEQVRSYCLQKGGVTEELPFGPDTLVFKVKGKMFALARLKGLPFVISLKCDPDRAQLLREEHPQEISGAYHLNKKHWNSILSKSLSSILVKDLIDHSYELVVKGLSKKDRSELNNEK